MHACKTYFIMFKSCSQMVECLFASWKWPAQQISPQTQVKDFTKKGMRAKNTNAAVLDRSEPCDCGLPILQLPCIGGWRESNRFMPLQLL